MWYCNTCYFYLRLYVQKLQCTVEYRIHLHDERKTLFAQNYIVYSALPLAPYLVPVGVASPVVHNPNYAWYTVPSTVLWAWYVSTIIGVVPQS